MKSEDNLWDTGKDDDAVSSAGDDDSTLDLSEISPENHIKLGRCFGDLHIHPAAPKMKNYPQIFEINTDKNSKIANGAEDFHSDVSCDIEPPLGTMLQLHILPECGGDTMFANMYMAYEA